MKTAEEWIKQSGKVYPREIVDTNCRRDEACECRRCNWGVEFFLLPEDIRVIQLDAIKEGMTRAAKIAEIPCDPNPETDYSRGSFNGHWWASKNILTACDNLTTI